MKILELNPVPERPDDFDRIEKAISTFLSREFYAPLLSEIDETPKVLKNDLSKLADAIAAGRIQFVRGHFEGSFSAAVSKELKLIGAKWDRKHGWWKILHTDLPVDLRVAIGTSESKFAQISDKVQKKLEAVLPEEMAEKLRLDALIDTSIFKIEKDLKRSTGNITVMPQLTPHRRKVLAEEYNKNAQLSISGWLQKEIVKLRKQVQKNMFNGNRYEDLIDIIHKSHEVSQNKAKFIARQETKIFINTYKNSRYQDAGVNKYRWQTVAGTKDHPVREDHKRLNGKIFSFDDPPVVNSKGDKKNPGFDFGCRCVAIPIVKF